VNTASALPTARLCIGLAAGAQRYAIEAARVVELIPRLPAKRLALAPPPVLGLFNYRGTATPMLDLGLLLGQAPCEDRLSSRVLVLDIGAGPRPRRVGLVAEGVTEVLMESGEEQPAVGQPEAPFLGGVFFQGVGIVQVIKPERLVPESLWTLLLGAEAAP
jgi:chemotaxis-related protein WspB